MQHCGIVNKLEQDKGACLKIFHPLLMTKMKKADIQYLLQTADKALDIRLGL